MKDQNFESLPAEETQDHFQNAMELYHSGFVEDGYALKSLASVRVEDALECAGRVLEDFKYAQRKVIYEAARTGADLEHFMNPKFSATHMKFILEQEQAGKNVTWLPVGKLHKNIVNRPLTKAEIDNIKKQLQESESRQSVMANLEEKKQICQEPGKTKKNKEKGAR